MGRTRNDIDFYKLRAAANQAIAAGEVSKAFMARALGYSETDSINKFLKNAPIPYNKVEKLCSLLGRPTEDFIIIEGVPEQMDLQLEPTGNPIADILRQIGRDINEIAKAIAEMKENDCQRLQEGSRSQKDI